MFEYLTLLRDGAVLSIVDFFMTVTAVVMLWHVLDRLPKRQRYQTPPPPPQVWYPFPTAPPAPPVPPSAPEARRD